MQLNSSTTQADIDQRWGSTVGREELRTGNARKNRLQRLARLRSRDYDTKLSLDAEHPTAHVDQHANGGPEIVVTARELEQPLTDYSPEVWDWLAQKSFAIHEVGHIKYTDSDDFKERLSNLKTDDKGMAKQIWNALEDGAIETQIRRRWKNYSVPLLHLRANLFHDNNPGIEDPEKGGRLFPVAHAIFTGCLDLATYNSGVYQRLLDADDDEYHFVNDSEAEHFKSDIAPLIAEVVPKVLSEPNAVKRNGIIFDFIDEVLPEVDDSQADGKAQMNRDEQNSAGMPDDASENSSGKAQDDADALGDESGQAAQERIEDITGESGDGEGVESGDGPVKPVDPDETLPPEDGGDDDSGQADAIETDESLEDEMRQDVADQRQEESGMTSDLREELGKLSKLLGSVGELENDRLEVPEGQGNCDETRFGQYRANSQRFEQLLRNRLQKERKSKTNRGTRRGRFTGQGGAMSRAQMGERGVKERKSTPDEKDYKFVIVVDRSGSMSGTKTTEAEETLNTVGIALEAVGVDTMVIDLLNSRASVAKPFGVSFEMRKGHTCTGRSTGGTPLTQTIRMARERLKAEPTSAQKAMLVITDGYPSDPEGYAAELERCTMPVIGVQLTGEDGAGQDYYHRYVTAKPGSGQLQGKIRELVQEAMDI